MRSSWMEVLDSHKLSLRIGCSIMPCIQSVLSMFPVCHYFWLSLKWRNHSQVAASISSLLLLNRGSVFLCEPWDYVLWFLFHSDHNRIWLYCVTQSFQIFPDLGDNCADGNSLYVYQPKTKVLKMWSYYGKCRYSIKTLKYALLHPILLYQFWIAF